MSKIDLHMHSWYSGDSEYSVKQIMQMCALKGMEIVSVTDHNSVQGIDQLLHYGRQMEIQVISGIELDCIYQGVGFHLLGYGIDHTNSRYAEIETDGSRLPAQYMTLPEAIDLIHQTNGKAVLAHPGQNLKGNDKLLDDIIGEKIDGIEVFSTYHSKEEEEKFHQIARTNNLVITAGSDFHGKKTPQIEIGGHGAAELDLTELF